MTDRNVNISIKVDDSALKGLGETIKGVRDGVRGLADEIRSMGSSVPQGGGTGSAARPSPGGAGQVHGSQSATLLNAVRQQGRQFDKMINLLERIASTRVAAARGSVGGGGGDSLDGDRRSIRNFVKGGQLSQIGSRLGGGFGELASGAGTIVQGAQAGPVGLGLGVLSAGIDFAKNRQKEAEDARDRRIARAEEADRKIVDAQGSQQKRFERSSLERSILADPLGEGGLEAETSRRRGDIFKRTDQLAHNNRTLGDTATGNEQRAKNLEEEKALRTELLQLTQREAIAANEKVQANERVVSLLNQERAALLGSLDAANKRLQGQKADFGELSKSQQKKTAKIADKIDRGEKLTKSEERFAAKSDLLREDAEKIFAKKAEDSGNFSEGLKRRAGGLQVQQVEGQIKLLDDRLKAAKLEASVDLVPNLNALKAQLKAEGLEISATVIAAGLAGKSQDEQLQGLVTARSSLGG